MTDTFDAVLAEMLETADVRDLRDGAVHTELVREWRDRLAAAHAAELAERDARFDYRDNIITGHAADTRKYQKQIQQSEARAEAAERDARRYRWLKENDSAFLLAEDVLDDQIAIATTEQAAGGLVRDGGE